MGRLARWRGLVTLGTRVALGNVFENGQSTLSVAGVAVAVGLMLTVTSIGLGIATGGVAADQSTDYVVLPDGDASSVVANVEGQQLGGVHRSTHRIESFSGVEWATPLLIRTGGVNVSGDRKYLLVVGVIPADGVQVAGLSTSALTAGDPMYAGEPRTGETVLSSAAAETLGYAPGDQLTVSGGTPRANRSFTVVAVAEPSEPGLGQLPVAIVHLSELQAITGGQEADVADRILVSGSGPRLEQRLGSVYPNSKVVTRSELLQQQVLDSQLTLAVGVGAFLIAVGVGVLFIATTMGFELAADSDNRLVMRALGISRRSRMLLVGIRTVVVCLLGGLGGLILWLVGAGLVNLAARAVSGGTAVAVLHPALAVLGLGAALVTGLVTAPYLIVASRLDAEEVAP